MLTVEQPSLQSEPCTEARRHALVVRLLVLGGVLTWACWTTFVELGEKWWSDPRYSHGFLVPLFAGYLLWQRRGAASQSPCEPSIYGIVFLITAAALRLAGVVYYVDWVRDFAILPLLAGVALLVGGWQALRRAWPALLFLVFMIPLPYRIESLLGAPLQRVAVKASVYGLQLLGQAAVAEGNIIRMPGNVRVNVAEACNGLGMLMLFFAFSTGAALVVRRPLLDRFLIVLGAVPIALGANVVRIVAAGFLYVTFGGRVSHVVYHDLAGWMMMPLALSILCLELWILNHLFEQVPIQSPLPIEQLTLHRERVSV